MRTGMQRLAIAFFYDAEGIVDAYYLHWLDALRPFVERLVLVVNGPLTEAGRAALRARTEEVIERDNEGFDVWAYRAGLLHVGWETLARYDEVLLFNHTFFGPLYPLAELFGAMAARTCDFWGITAHKAVPGDPARNAESLPFHLNSHFIAVRRPMAASEAFAAYWIGMPAIGSYEASIRLHELVFTPHFQALGFAVGAYVDPALYGSDYNAFMELDETLLRSRSPLLKRRAFFHDPTFVQQRAIDLPRALRILAATSDYPQELIWPNIVRATNARTLYTNAALLTVLPDEPRPSPRPPREIGRIAVCAHAYYEDLLPELLESAAAIPGRYDLIVTTDTAEKKARIEAMAAGRPGIGETIVRLTRGRGRDMGALLVACHDLMTSGRYDLVCRVHTKKAPQVDAPLGNLFKRHTLGNVLPGRAGVAAILALFAENAQLGLVMPPMFHIGYPTFGHSWFVNRGRAEAVAKVLGIRAALDEFSPVAAYGGMFWFRPQALRRLFAGWRWEDFEGEPHPIDGALAHALERILVYAAMTDGYTVRTAMTAAHAAHNYTALEFKHNIVTGLLPTGDFVGQARVLGRNRDALWHSHASGLPSLAPAEAETRALETAAAVSAATERAAAARRSAAEAHAAAHELECNAAALLAEAQGEAANGLRAEIERLQVFLAAAAHPAGEGRPAPDRGAVTRYVLSHRGASRLCPLFDEAWFGRKLRQGGRGAGSPLDQFLAWGWAAGLSPHPLFNTRFYRSTQPDQAAATDVPLRGYLTVGAPARHTPHPLFDPLHYARQLASPTGVRDLLVHYLTVPEAWSHDPHPLFDARAYRAAAPTQAPATEPPLAHFVAAGWKADRDPHPLFDVAYYRAQQPDGVDDEEDPLCHYLRIGWSQGRDPHPLFDTRYYLAVNPDVRAAGINPLVHFVLYGVEEGRNPHGYFDVTFYRQAHPEVARAGLNPLVDYLARGNGARRQPSRAFDGQAYLADHPDVATAGINPLVHFVRWGRGEQRRIRPLRSSV